MLHRAQPTLSALARVTVHKRPDGTFTAVDLRDGCFGTATIMRIVAMFVPHSIFEDRAPDGARISRCSTDPTSEPYDNPNPKHNPHADPDPDPSPYIILIPLAPNYC